MCLSVTPQAEIHSIKTRLVQKMALLEGGVARSEPPQKNNTVPALLLSVVWMVAAALQQRRVANDLILVHNGKVWDDDNCLADYNYYCSSSSNNNSSGTMTVHASTRLHGGCFMVSATVFCLLCTAIVGSTCTCGLSLVAVPFLLPLLFVLPLFCL